MRITQNMMVNNALFRINKNRENLNSLHQSITTGKRIHNSSDDPQAYSKVSILKLEIAQNNQFLKNLNDAIGWVDETMSSLDQLNSIVSDLKAIAQKGSDGMLSANDRIALAKSVDGLIEQSISVLNTRYAGKYIFAGNETKGSNPFVLNSNVVQYNGNDELITRLISKDLQVDINTSGQKIQDTNYFQVLLDLKDALNNDDVPSIQTSIDELKSLSDEILNISTTAGSIRKSLALSEQRLDSTNLSLTALISREEDADLAEVIIKFEAEEMAYRAALQATSEVMKINLLDYLPI